MSRSVALHGKHGYFHGTVDERGRLAVHGPNGDYLTGELDDRGNIKMNGKSGYYHGKLSGSTAAVHGPDGDYLHGKIG